MNARLLVRNLTLAAVQAVVILLAYYFAMGIRFDFDIPAQYAANYRDTVWLLILCRLPWLWVFQLIQRSWRHVSPADLTRVVEAVASGSALFLMVLWFWQGQALGGVPRSVYALEAIFSVVVLSFIRLLARYAHEFMAARGNHDQKRALVVGIDNRAINVVKFLASEPRSSLRVVGFLCKEIDGHKKGMTILSHRIWGTIAELEHWTERLKVDVAIILLPDVSIKMVREVKDRFTRMGVECRVLRSPEDILPRLRDVVNIGEVSDHLVMSRDRINILRQEVLGEAGRGKVVLVTGAAGSIGSELCRQLATRDVGHLVMLDQNESGLYDIDQELSRHAPDIKRSWVLCDITNRTKLTSVLRTYRPQLIYHAAAYKHVPMMEADPYESLSVNVLGSYYLGQASIKFKVEKLVMISTDKAVEPVSVMGKTKLIAERTLLSLNGGSCKFVVVRFGNVINSAGSVIPLFRRQVQEGGPITVTHPEVTRFFMATNEAVQLVMAAGQLGSGGEVFLLDMGKPVKIMDVAQKIVRFAGLEFGTDIAVKIIGLRPGERLHEELYWKGEGISPTVHPLIHCTKGGRVPLNFLSQWMRRSEELVAGFASNEAVLDVIDEFVSLSQANGHVNSAAPAEESAAAQVQ